MERQPRTFLAGQVYRPAWSQTARSGNAPGLRLRLAPSPVLHYEINGCRRQGARLLAVNVLSLHRSRALSRRRWSLSAPRSRSSRPVVRCRHAHLYRDAMQIGSNDREQTRDLLAATIRTAEQGPERDADAGPARLLLYSNDVLYEKSGTVHDKIGPRLVLSASSEAAAQ
jgi:hypothetical protein